MLWATTDHDLFEYVSSQIILRGAGSKHVRCVRPVQGIRRERAGESNGEGTQQGVRLPPARKDQPQSPSSSSSTTAPTHPGHATPLEAGTLTCSPS